MYMYMYIYIFIQYIFTVYIYTVYIYTVYIYIEAYITLYICADCTYNSMLSDQNDRMALRQERLNHVE